jgi:ubiquinone/menaquinone biosynthesis C-methylase UbiE
LAQPLFSLEAAMTNNTSVFAGNIPEHYDEGLGPVLFVEYAEDIARRVAAYAPKRVLETAAGTGIVSRRIKDALPDAEITATDLNAPMLERAAAKFKRGEAIEFRPADATALPFADGEFDAVVCQFGVMFYPDKETSYREAHRALRARGRYLFSVWDSHKHNPFGRIAHEIACSFFPVDPPQFYQVPFGYSSIDPIKEALIAAGFDDLKIAVVGKEKKIADVAALARGMVLGNPLIDQIKARGGVDPDRVVEAAQQRLQREFGERPMPLQAIVFDARKAG